MAHKFTWIQPYEAIAKALREMANEPSKMVGYFVNHSTDTSVERADPLSFMAFYNRSLTYENRTKIVKGALEAFGLAIDAPSDYYGIPVANNQKWRYQSKEECFTKDDWRYFCALMDYAENPSAENRKEFIESLDITLGQKNCGMAKLTMAAYWARPSDYIPLDAKTVSYLKDAFGIEVSKKEFSGEVYLDLLSLLREKTEKPFYEISAEAYEHDGWLPPIECFDPGITKAQWVNLLEGEGRIASDETLIMLACFLDFGGQATCTELADKYGRTKNYYNNTAASFAKKVAEGFGLGKCSYSQFSADHWWPVLFQGKEAQKSQSGSWVWRLRDSLKDALGSMDLSEIELYADFIEAGSESVDSAESTSAYSDSDFLSQVFVDEQGLADMKGLLARKKNLILQGAPGTGKTFAAKRLAWAVMGEKDDSRIKFVQFHQSSTYEDFMVGYKPNAQGGFVPQRGAFVEFCNQAASNPGKSHFFIIDEINRANISKVFGEMLMLIEADHRGDTVLLPLLDEEFCVPGNVYIIGMMNTADRGLALIDYALRRRFAFFEMKPALNALQFKAHVEGAGNEKLGKLVQAVRVLNDAIAKDALLGRGFCVGHSYFCFDGEVSDEDVERLIRYELIPLIEEYWFDDQKRVQQESDALMAVLNG